MQNPLRLLDFLPLRCLLSVPNRHPPGRGWPLLVFLHGYDEAAPAEIHEALTRHGPLRPGSAPSAAADFAVLAPQLPIAGDLWHRYSAELIVILEHIEAPWRIDPERLYLTGFSFGGNGVFELGAQHAERWAALWAVDPTRVPAQEPHRPIWLSSGQASRRSRAGFTERLRLQAPELGGERIYLDEGLDHVVTAARAYADPRIYRWLLKKRRKTGLALPAHAAHADIL